MKTRDFNHLRIPLCMTSNYIHYFNKEVMKKVKASFFKVMKYVSRQERRVFKRALKDGKINGTCYYDNECGCLLGTIAACRNQAEPEWRRLCACGCDIVSVAEELSSYLRDNIDDRYLCQTWIENFIYYIVPGNTPNNNEVAAQVYDWLKEYDRKHGS